MTNKVYSPTRKKVEAFEMFCGIGGLSFGFKYSTSHPIKIVGGLDNDLTAKETFEKNTEAPFIHADITNFDFNKIKDLYSKDAIKILSGGAPCQPFSRVNTQGDFDTDDRKNLLGYFLEAVKIVKPDIVIIENVIPIDPQRKFHKETWSKREQQNNIFTDVFLELVLQNYDIQYEYINFADFEVPQNRKRLILIAVLKNLKFSAEKIFEKLHVLKRFYKEFTVRDVISFLPKINAGEIHKDMPFHSAPKLSDLTIQRLKLIPEGGSWQDLPKELVPACYKRVTSFRSSYGRLNWDKPSTTITTKFQSFGSGRFGHPDQNRTLSILEGALLQGFPLTHLWFGGKNSDIRRHIGNAIPPLFAHKLGTAILEAIQDND